MRAFIVFFSFVVLYTIHMPYGAEAVPEPEQRDIDNDGQTDQILHYDPAGRIIRIEVDSNGDGLIDRIQHYERDVLQLVEQDTDYDKQVDTFDFFVQGKRIRNECLRPDGHVERIIYFDNRERPLNIEKDADGDGTFDTFWKYKEGQLQLLTRDTDADGRMNLWQTYDNGKPVECREDSNADGQIDKHIWFDDKGLPVKSYHDLDFDTVMDEFRSYQAGHIVLQKKDLNHDNRFEEITRFAAGKPTKQEKDANLDGIYDIITRFQEGNPLYQEKDSNFDGKKDIFNYFNTQGQLEKCEEDTRYCGQIDRLRFFCNGVLHRVEYDEDQDRVMETITLYEEGKRWLQTRDNNRDGNPDEKIYFNRKGEKKKVEQDSNLDGRFDTWQFYRQGQLLRIEKDESSNGTVDLIIHYTNDHKERLLKDRDNNGHFEMTQWFNRRKWSEVIEIDENGDKHPEVRISYRGDVLGKKEVDENMDGQADLIEHYNDKGLLIRSQEDHGNTSSLNITWYYNDREEAVRSEKDSNADGRVDTWFYYRNGLVTRVEEDTNLDGQPDIWEEYDDAEALIRRSKDLDFDGKADTIYQRENSAMSNRLLSENTNYTC